MFYKSILYLLFLSAAFISGCAYKDMKKGTYDALQDRQCVVETGLPGCDPEHQTYDEYKEERDKVLEESKKDSQEK